MSFFFFILRREKTGLNIESKKNRMAVLREKQ